VSPRGGLSGPPSFVACSSISVVVIELCAVEPFCLTPVIVCFFFVAGVLSMLEMQVYGQSGIKLTSIKFHENRSAALELLRMDRHGRN
jgi:hypothetical protein